jgi:glycosyltransferase involved in cell wall biosynthesis
MISVVTPSYNQLDWLRLAIASIADQETDTYEHLIQDAGTPGLSDSLQREFPRLFSDGRLQCFTEKDAGMYDAINRGLAKARGDICAYLNCDEQYLPGTLNRVAAFFESQPTIDVLFGDVLVVDRAGKTLSYRRPVRPQPDHIRLSHLNTFSCATFFRRRILEHGHWLDSKWKSIGDAVWIYGILKAGFRTAVYPGLLSVFSLTGNNLSTENPISLKEQAQWLAASEAPSPLYRPWHIGLYRMKKLLTGAYQKRTFDYEIYTLDSPSRRVRLTAKKVGGVWKTK